MPLPLALAVAHVGQVDPWHQRQSATGPVVRTEANTDAPPGPGSAWEWLHHYTGSDRNRFTVRRDSIDRRKLPTSFHLPPDLLAFVNQQAARSHMTRNEWLTRLVVRELQGEQGPS